MEKAANLFNACKHCGAQLRIVRTQRYEHFRIRTYVCSQCFGMIRSCEQFITAMEALKQKKEKRNAGRRKSNRNRNSLGTQSAK